MANRYRQLVNLTAVELRIRASDQSVVCLSCSGELKLALHSSVTYPEHHIFYHWRAIGDDTVIPVLPAFKWRLDTTSPGYQVLENLSSDDFAVISPEVAQFISLTGDTLRRPKARLFIAEPDSVQGVSQLRWIW